MAASLWQREDGAAHLRRLELSPWRVVESQTVISTRKLVDSLDEQDVLEQLVDRVKPPLPAWPRLRGLHYLLSTPFRHPPLRNGSRFGTRLEPGIWYGSKRLDTAFAEVAYYRFIFLDGTAATLPQLVVELSAFRAKVRSSKAADLTRPPFAAHAARISSKTSYAASQQLGRDMRASGVEAFVFRSARDPRDGDNVGLLAPAFAAKNPTPPESWVCTATPRRVDVVKKDVFRRQRFAFDRGVFEVGGKLPVPAT